MRRVISTLLFFLLAISQAQADTLVLKSGENKKGKVVEEKGSLVLFKQEDGLVIEVPRSKISILDKDPLFGGSPKGSVGVFSESPRKKPYKFLVIGDGVGTQAQEETAAESASKKRSDNAGFSFDSMSNFVDRWLADHPEIEKKMKELLGKSQAQSDALQKLVDSAKQA